MKLESALRESIAFVCDVPLERVTDEAVLEQLGLDSLAAAEVITNVEIRLGRDLPMDVLRRLNQVRTVGDVAAELRAAAGHEAVSGQ
jgi:acyl carrier protein